MKKKILAAALIGISLSFAVAQAGDNETRFDLVIKEVLNKSRDCHVDLLKSAIASSPEEKSYFVTRTDNASAHLKELSQLLSSRGVRLEFSYLPHPKFRSCVFSEDGLRLNPGSIDAIEYLLDTLKLEPKKPITIHQVRILVSPFKSHKLYDRNSKIKIAEKSGRKTAIIYVNAGDYEAGLTNQSVYTALFGG